MATFTEFTTTTNWVSGVEGEYEFNAKLFDEPSEFGIRNGRVSKLSIYDRNGIVVNYDRGWEIKPDRTVRKAYNSIMKLLEDSPKRWAVVTAQ